MEVKLRNDWFAPDGNLYRQKDNPHSFQDEWKDKLPKSAKVLPPVEEDDEDEGSLSFHSS